MTSAPARDLEAIFRAALDRVDPVRMMKRVLRLEGDVLLVETELSSARFDLSAFDRIVVTGMG
ncbi:MAG TPA: glycerate kinase, partial [Thermoanaerobaculia bacterium]|nr:glycerate kinase [Thermoanaerobaculia bacterium]